MKAFLVAVFVVGCIAAAIGGAEEHDAKFKHFADECKTEMGIDEDICKKVKDGEFDEPKLPAFLFCVFKKMDIINDAGEYQVEAMKEGLTEKFDAEIANHIVEECTKDGHGNGQENSLALAKCYHQNAPKE